MIQLRGIFSLLAVYILIVLTGCSSNGNEFYKHQPSLPPLEVPPDLTLLSIESGFDIPRVASIDRKQIVLADGSNVRLEKDGRLRWLHFGAAPDDVWDEVKDYWIANKVPLKWQNVKLGLMETDWVDNYDSEFVLDRFRVRLESKDKGETTELYLTHRGMQTDVVEGEMVRGWAEHINDPEIEIEVLGDMLNYLGLNAERKEALLAMAQKKAEEALLVLDDDIPHIVIKDPFNRSWRFTLQAIDRMGHVVTLKDREEGLIDVRVTEEGVTSDFIPGFSLSDTDREVYRLQLRGEEKQTRLVVLSDQGQADRSVAARTYLEKLHSFLAN